jgi:large subunit ribosomal protein L21
MYAIVAVGGKQFRVEEGQELEVPKLAAEPGGKVELDQVLLISQPGKVQVGQPTVAGAKVSATVVEHGRGKKVVVFKKKRRKGYRVKRGHHQEFTRIRVEGIKTASRPRKKKVEAAEAAVE